MKFFDSPDVIVIADSGIDSFSATNPLRLSLDGFPANIQVVQNFVKNEGRVVPPIVGDGISSWGAAPKLNGIYLFNYLNKKGIKVALINNFQTEYDRFTKLSHQGPKVIVVSTTYIVNRKVLLNLVAKLKSICPSAVVVVGGPFVAMSWRIFQEAENNKLYSSEDIKKQFLFFDPEEDLTDLYIVSDYGENILCDVVNYVLAEDLRWLGSPNTARINDGRYVFSDRIDDILEREEIPIDWGRLPEQIFSSHVVPMRASVGCPYQCAFCNFNKDPRLAFVKPIDQLVEELKAVVSKGVKYVWFVDDNFRLGKNDIQEVCERLISENISLNWMTLIRPETLKNVDLDLLRRAGCVEVQMGLESADPLVLEVMNKKSDPAFNEEIVKRLMAVGINCACYFIFGHPGETNESLVTTANFIKRLEESQGLGHFKWSLYPFLLAPFSKIYDNQIDYGLEGYLQNWTHKTMDSEKVQKFLIELFMELKHSSPIYRGDNLDQIKGLSTEERNAFYTVRHKLEKLHFSKTICNEKMFKDFSQVFNFKRC